MELRYMGFEQRQSARAYRFDGVTRGAPTIHFVITADLALFLKHQIGIQEGPNLCARKLATDIAKLQPGEHVLTNDDLLEYVRIRSEAEERRAAVRRGGIRRRPPSPSPAPPRAQ
ncbi:MAG: hypothetical protein ACKV22_14545 [Bryobacteraceae bacterium]